jgi:hypothetical protein
MKKFRKHLFAIFFIIVTFINTSTTFAGTPDPCDDPDAYPCDCKEGEIPEWCPIDGGVIALLAAGVGLGIKRVRDSRKAQS